MPNPLRVLVADDEQPIRLLCRVNLEAEGMLVEEAADGEQALTLVHLRRPDIAVLDVMMPRLDGWEVARRLRESPATADLPLIFLTAVGGRDAEQRVAALRGQYIPKPFNPVKLSDAVRLALTGTG
jgi:CheY-like chemotaxis protein